MQYMLENTSLKKNRFQLMKLTFALFPKLHSIIMTLEGNSERIATV